MFGNVPVFSVPDPHIWHIITAQHSHNTQVHFIPITVPPASNAFSFTAWSMNMWV